LSRETLQEVDGHAQGDFDIGRRRIFVRVVTQPIAATHKQHRDRHDG
jgi:hypothetical protein